jgi:hypothetical protein
MGMRYAEEMNVAYLLILSYRISSLEIAGR